MRPLSLQQTPPSLPTSLPPTQPPAILLLANETKIKTLNKPQKPLVKNADVSATLPKSLKNFNFGASNNVDIYESISSSHNNLLDSNSLARIKPLLDNLNEVDTKSDVSSSKSYVNDTENKNLTMNQTRSDELLKETSTKEGRGEDREDEVTMPKHC